MHALHQCLTAKPLDEDPEDRHCPAGGALLRPPRQKSKSMYAMRPAKEPPSPCHLSTGSMPRLSPALHSGEHNRLPTLASPAACSRPTSPLLPRPPGDILCAELRSSCHRPAPTYLVVTKTPARTLVDRLKAAPRLQHASRRTFCTHLERKRMNECLSVCSFQLVSAKAGRH